MRPGSSRPPPAREVALPAVCGRLAEWPRPAEVDGGRILKSDDLTTVPVVGVNELDTVRQLAGHHRQMTVVLCDVQLVRYHTFDSVRKQIEISLDTPWTAKKVIQKEKQDTSSATEDHALGICRVARALNDGLRGNEEPAVHEV